jgi:hypothetical protein
MYKEHLINEGPVQYSREQATALNGAATILGENACIGTVQIAAVK